MNIIFAYCLLVSAVVYAFVTSKYYVGAALVFGVIVVETVVNIPRDFVGTFFTLLGMVAITVLVIMEGKKHAKNSVLIRYNPFYKENVLSKNIQIIICTILSLALLARVVTFFCSAEDANRGRVGEQYLEEANASPTNTISQYDYVYDAAGRRVAVSKSGTAVDANGALRLYYNYHYNSNAGTEIPADDSEYYSAPVWKRFGGHL